MSGYPASIGSGTVCRATVQATSRELLTRRGTSSQYLSSVSPSGVTICLLLTLLAGCAGYAGKRDGYVVPEVPVPTQFRQQARAPAAEPAPLAPEAPLEDALGSSINFVDDMLSEWWRVLGSKELDALMDRTIANNADLRIATLRIAQAKARSEQAGADELPAITAPFEARTSAPAGGPGSGAPGQEITSRRLYQGSLRADWRLDVWGERLALTESAQMQLWRSIYQRDDARRTVVSSVASQYVEYLSLNDRLRVARETEIVLRGMLDAVSSRLKAGDATITELEQQRAAVFSVRATIPGLELQRENIINSLAQLLGATPGSLELSHRGMDSLIFPRILPGVPANLLLRRPDVRAVEARLLAADADIDLARTRLLPAIDLTSQVGYGSLVFSRLFQPHNLAWSAIATLSATIFDYGKRANEVNFARAVHEELVETYVRVLYSAIRETEDAIATVQMNVKRLDAQNSATRAAKRAWDLSSEAYREGAIDYLTLLDTERTYHRNLDEFHRISMERHKGLVSLFSSLGGGVPKNTPAPSRGSPPAGALGDEYSIRAAARAPIQFLPYALEAKPGEPFWLVELSGMHDRVGVTHVWRDLINRFPELMSDRIILPRLQGSVATEREEKAAWYRLFIAKFATADAAKSFCDRLGTALIRCRAIPHDSPAYQDGQDNSELRAIRPNVAGTPIAATESRPAQARRTASREATPNARDGSISAPSLQPAPASPPARQRRAETLTLAGVDSVPPLSAQPPARSPEPAAPPIERWPETSPPSARIAYAVQLATTFNDEDASAASRKWTRKGYENYVYPVARSNGNLLYTVRTGIFAKQKEAAAQAAVIRRDQQIYAVPVPVTLDESGWPAPAAAPKNR